MLEAQKLSFRYGKHSSRLFSGLDLQIAPGRIVGMPGPSGKGKSTLAKVLAGYLTPESGRIIVDEHPLPRTGFCPVQLIFQHPERAVNPRWKIMDVLQESQVTTGSMTHELGIEEDWLRRYPHELSGGELQRVCLARALISPTRYLLCDEMTAMLDAVTQAHIWRVVLQIVRTGKLGLLVISHDKNLIEKLCDAVIPYFMYEPI